MNCALSSRCQASTPTHPSPKSRSFWRLSYANTTSMPCVPIKGTVWTKRWIPISLVSTTQKRSQGIWGGTFWISSHINLTKALVRWQQHRAEAWLSYQNSKWFHQTIKAVWRPLVWEYGITMDYRHVTLQFHANLPSVWFQNIKSNRLLLAEGKRAESCTQMDSNGNSMFYSFYSSRAS